MKKSVFIIFLLVLILFSYSAYASINTKITPVMDKMFIGEEAKFKLNITNTGSVDEQVEIKTPSYDWLLASGEGTIGVKGDDSEEIILLLKPKIDRKPGFYDINLIIDTGREKIKQYVTIEIINKSKTLDADVLNNAIDPRKSTILKIKIDNPYDREIGKLTFNAKSSIFNLSKKIDAGALYSEILEFNLVVDPKTEEGIYDVDFSAVDSKGQNYMTSKKQFKVLKYTDVKEIIEPLEGFLIYGEKISEKNDGNEKAERKYTKMFSSFAKAFTSFNPEPDEIAKTGDGDYKAVWNIVLSPGELKTVEYKTNYLTPLAILILVIAVIVIIYLFVRKPIYISKKVLTLHSKKGNIAIMKVVINIKSNRREALNNVSILDKVPKIIKAPTEFGLEHPSHVEHTPEGTKIIWNIAALRARQEKILSYKIESNIQVLGKMELPAAAAVIRKGDKRIIVRSSQCTIKERL